MWLLSCICFPTQTHLIWACNFSKSLWFSSSFQQRQCIFWSRQANCQKFHRVLGLNRWKFLRFCVTFYIEQSRNCISPLPKYDLPCWGKGSGPCGLVMKNWGLWKLVFKLKKALAHEFIRSELAPHPQRQTEFYSQWGVCSLLQFGQKYVLWKFCLLIFHYSLKDSFWRKPRTSTSLCRSWSKSSLPWLILRGTTSPSDRASSLTSSRTHWVRAVHHSRPQQFLVVRT